MPKIEVSTVAEIIKKNPVEPATARAIIEEINLACQTDEGDAEKAPAVKKQFVVLVSDPDGVMPNRDLVAWVMQIEESESVSTTQDRIHRAAYDYNASKKGRLYPCKTVGEALESVPTKSLKEAGVWVKTKMPVLVMKTNNQIPRA